VAATTAPYVLPLDSDDLLEEGSATALADALDRTPAVGFAYGDYREFGAVNRINRVPRSLLPWSTTYVHLYTPTHMFRRTTLEELGGWPPIRREDWALMLACIERGIDGVHVDRVVYARRMHEGTMSDDNRRRHRSQYAELRRRYRPVFERRAELARIERPPLWKRVAYPLVFGRRLLVPRRVEQRLRRTTIWARLRPLRR
jgi:hypothetical protein